MKRYESTFHQHNGICNYLFYRFRIERDNPRIQTEKDVEKVLRRFVKEERVNHSHHEDIFRTVQNNWSKFVKWCNSNLEKVKH